VFLTEFTPLHSTVVL